MACGNQSVMAGSKWPEPSRLCHGQRNKYSISRSGHIANFRRLVGQVPRRTIPFGIDHSVATDRHDDVALVPSLICLNPFIAKVTHQDTGVLLRRAVEKMTAMMWLARRSRPGRNGASQTAQVGVTEGS